MVLQFKKAEMPDIPSIVQLVNSAYRGDSSRKGWTTEADFLGGQRTDHNEIELNIKKENCEIILAHSDGNLLGCVFLERSLTNSEQCYLGMLTVQPGSQAAGLGRKILEHSEIMMANLGCRQMILGVVSIRTELIAWYLRRGYQSTNEYKPFPYGDERFGIPLRDDLRFLMFKKELTGPKKKGPNHSGPEGII